MFKNKQLIAWCLFTIVTLSLGCKSKFEKLRASNDTGRKYQEALRLYNKKDYSKALILFDDLTQRYRGMAEFEDLSYYTAYTNYNLRDYTTARYQFKVFSDSYPSDQRAEECRYMSAYCYYLDSPKFSLDQENTLKAIDALQLFINLYPKSERVAEASKLIGDLRDKLETKAYTQAKQYLDMGGYDAQNYRSAVIAFKNALRDFPDTKYAEEMEYLTIKSQYLFAKNSLETKQEERFEEAIELYDEFTDKFPQSPYLKDATGYKEDSQKGIEAVKKLLAVEMPADSKTDSTTIKKQN